MAGRGVICGIFGKAKRHRASPLIRDPGVPEPIGMDRVNDGTNQGKNMKILYASIVALSLLSGTAASAAGIGVHVGGIGIGVGVHGHHHHHGCRGWGYRHHHRYCRGYW